MTKMHEQLGREIRLLTGLHAEIRSVCEKLGLNVKAAEELADEAGLPLPWRGEAAPGKCASNAVRLLRTPPDPTKGALDLVYDGEGTFEIGNSTDRDTTVGMLGAVAVMKNPQWGDAGKAAFLVAFPGAPLESWRNFVTGFDPRAHPKAFEGALCWLVHDVLAVSLLQGDKAPKDFEAVSGILLSGNAGTLGDLAAEAARAADDPLGIKSRVEEVLHLMGAQNPTCRGLIAAILPTFEEYAKPSGGEFYDQTLFVREMLQGLYPDPVQASRLDGAELQAAADTYRRNMAAGRALAQFLKEDLVSAEEWANPLGVAVEAVEKHGVVRVSFVDATLIDSAKGKEILQALVTRTPGVKVVLSVKQLIARGPEDPPWEALADEFKLFVDKNRESFVSTRTADSNYDERRTQAITLLRSLSEVIGSRNLEVVAPSAVEPAANAGGQPTLLIAESDEFSGPTVAIVTKRSEPVERSVESLLKSLAAEQPSVVLANDIRIAIRKWVVPSISGPDTPRDEFGLNGFCPKVAVGLSGVNIEGCGTFPELTEEHFDQGNCLTIMYTGNHKDSEKEPPVDAVLEPIDEEVLV